MRTKAKTFHRYHCFDSEGNKVVTTVMIGEVPKPLDGHSPWLRGLGRLPEEQRREVGKKISDRVKGVPKTAEQREKMRQAKLGVPKSEEHKRNMSISQLARVQRMREAHQNGSVCSTS